MNRLHILCVAAGIALVAPVVVTTGQSQAQINIEIGIAPPPIREEVVPPPPAHPEAFVWDKGYWRWNPGTHAHVWVRGHYVRLPHPGAVRVPGEWVQTPTGHWRFVPPHWA